MSDVTGGRYDIERGMNEDEEARGSKVRKNLSANRKENEFCFLCNVFTRKDGTLYVGHEPVYFRGQDFSSISTTTMPPLISTGLWDCWISESQN